MLLRGAAPAAGAVQPEIGPAPVRRVAPTPTVQPSVRPEELAAAEARLAGQLESGLKRAAEDAQSARKGLDALRADLEEISKKVARLGELQGDQQVRLDREVKEVQAFSELLGSLKQEVGQTLKKAEQARQDIERKGEKMEGLLDLVSTLKRDLNDNSHQIVELKAEVASLKARLKQAPEQEEGQWWDGLLRWRYLPATAAAISVIALGVAASR